MLWHPIASWLASMFPVDSLIIMVAAILLLLLFRPTRWYTIAGIIAFIIGGV